LFVKYVGEGLVEMVEKVEIFGARLLGRIGRIGRKIILIIIIKKNYY